MSGKIDVIHVGRRYVRLTVEDDSGLRSSATLNLDELGALIGRLQLAEDRMGLYDRETPDELD